MKKAIETAPHILIIEDESAIREMIKFALTGAGFSIAEAKSVKEAALEISKKIPDLMLLDWMLPDTSGIDFLRQLKQKAQTKNIRIIMLTARAEEDNKIKGLETGADDYVTKPFSPRELITRIKTILRRGHLLTQNGVMQINQLTLNTENHTCKIENESIELTTTEYKLLYFFMKNPDRIYSREHLLNQIWTNEPDINDRTVDVQIRRLRHRLEPFGYDKYIKTVHGRGYQFSEPSKKSA